MDSQERVQYNANGHPIQFWVIGDYANVSFLIEFLEQRFLEFTEKEKTEMKGKLRLGTNKVYKIEIKNLTYDEWNLEEKAHLKVDVVAFYQPGEVMKSPHWEEQQTWVCWGEVKAIVFLQCGICPGHFPTIRSDLRSDVLEKRIRRILKDTQIPKKLVPFPKKDTRVF